LSTTTSERPFFSINQPAMANKYKILFSLVQIILWTLNVAVPTTGALRSLGQKNTKQAQDASLRCRVVFVDTSYEGDVTDEEQVSCVPILEDDSESDDIWDLTLPNDVTENNHQALELGTLEVFITGATVVNEAVIMAAISVVTVTSSHRRKLVVEDVSGTKTVLVIRVSTVDAEPSASLQDLETTLFDSNRINMSTQYEKCSAGKLQLTLSATGVIDVRVNGRIADYDAPSPLVTAARKKLEEMLAVEKVSSLADKTMFCLPAGTGNWVASAGVGTWRSQFNNEWCLSLTATMHELGHTFGLRHSNESTEYDDRTGIMSYGHKSAVWPQKCFNGHKHWLLKWFEDRAITVNPVAGTALVELAAFVHYDKTSESHAVVVNVGDYYLQYNRAKAFNVGTEEMADLVSGPFASGSWGAHSIENARVCLPFSVSFLFHHRSRSPKVKRLLRHCVQGWGSDPTHLSTSGIEPVDPW